MTFIRSLLFNLVFFVATALTVLLGLPLLAAPQSWMVRYVRVWAKLVLATLRVLCGIKVAVLGRENLPDGPCVIAAKHQSAFDTIIWTALLPAPVYVMKKELLSIPLWATLAQRCGHIAVDRAAGASALRGMVKDAKAVIATGRPIVIFPEGTRAAPGARLPYQPGVMALAALGVPLVPVATDSGLLWGRRAFQKRPGTITLSILPPLSPGRDRHALLDQLRDGIEAETDRLVRASPYWAAG